MTAAGVASDGGCADWLGPELVVVGNGAGGRGSAGLRSRHATLRPSAGAAASADAAVALD
jgi:hypothetical protein